MHLKCAGFAPEHAKVHSMQKCAMYTGGLLVTGSLAGTQAGLAGRWEIPYSTSVPRCGLIE
jgi:hypothetical protein